MLLECICRLCLTKYENPNHLYVICENNLDIALASIFNRKIQPEMQHLYKICGPCGAKLIEFHNFYVNALQNEDKLLDLAFNEKLETKAATYKSIPSEQIMTNSQVEIINDDIEMSNDGFTNEFTSSTESFDFEPNSPMEFYHDPPKNDFIPIENVNSANTSFNISIEKEPMEVEAYPAKMEERRKKRCNECGVYVLNITQHKRCVHDFSGAQKCEECKSVFPNRLKLLMHKYYKHVPPRYKCEFCHKEFRTKTVLREHVYQKHVDGAYLYKCDFCSSQFNYHTSRITHQKRYHPNQYENAKQKRAALRYRP